MLISVLGSGCSKCGELYAHVLEAVQQSGQDIQVEKITDIMEIAAMGVMVTPALAIDKKVKATGKVLSVADILVMIKSVA